MAAMLLLPSEYVHSTATVSGPADVLCLMAGVLPSVASITRVEYKPTAVPAAAPAVTGVLP